MSASLTLPAHTSLDLGNWCADDEGLSSRRRASISTLSPEHTQITVSSSKPYFHFPSSPSLELRTAFVWTLLFVRGRARKWVISASICILVRAIKLGDFGLFYINENKQRQTFRCSAARFSWRIYFRRLHSQHRSLSSFSASMAYATGCLQIMLRGLRVRIYRLISSSTVYFW